MGKMTRIMLAMAMAMAILASVNAYAQESNTWTSGQFGMTRGGQSGWSGAAETGTMLTDSIGVYGSLGLLADATTSDMRQAVDYVGAAYNTQLSIRSPMFFGIGGAQLFVPMSRVKPYAVAGLGWGRMSPKIKEAGSDVTSEFEAILGAETSSTGRVLEFGGGVQLPGPTFVDIGYRYLHLGSGSHVSRFYAGVGKRF